MTDKIIAAAREAGFEVHPSKQQARVGWDALTGDDSTPKLARFYAIAYKQGLEDAAKECEKRLNYPNEIAGVDMDLRDSIDAIRALKEGH